MNSKFAKMSLKETKKRLQKLPKLFDKIEKILKDEPIQTASHDIAHTKRAQVLIEYIKLLLSIREKAKRDPGSIKSNKNSRIFS